MRPVSRNAPAGNPKPWPRGVRKPRAFTRLRGTVGEILAPMIARTVATVALESIKGQAMVAVDDQWRLYIEPVESVRAEWIFIRFQHWVVGTYTSTSGRDEIEEALCERLEELEDQEDAAA